ncbi:MAG TPA: hypothetical protein VKW04_04750 [Planctomycetota bacterium]|nr:hypothetical protein [Planctomycetota bacterium]
MDGQRPCPFCAEPIKLAAIKCKHCGEMMPGEVRPPAPPESPGARDDEHLKNLVLGHTVVSALTALFGCMFIMHLAIGIVSIVAPEKMGGGKSGPPPAFFGWMFAVMGGAAVLGFWTIAGAMFVAGRSIKRRKRHTFCLIVAGLSCFFMPFGTALGICSLMLLTRPTVKAQFLPPHKSL